MVASYLSYEAPNQMTITLDVLSDELHSQTVAGSFNTCNIALTSTTRRPKNCSAWGVSTRRSVGARLNFPSI
ncbi:hypothetical protein BKA56DRAFT_196638 [Ilyonectria sp. MPI-CAGE-AT-0026]|nr:hypothetical protein BKA56DRAFT_196638 [Ilyonectria sp. MPI-CAGE-AT-0026]